MLMDTNKTRKKSHCHACCHAEKKEKSQPLLTFHIRAIWKKKRFHGIKPMSMQVGQTERRVCFGVVAGLKGKGSGLLAAPLALYRPPEELLHMPCHIHGVVQVKVSVSVQHRVSPVTGHRVEPDHIQTSWQNITKGTSSSSKTRVHTNAGKVFLALPLSDWTLSECLPWTLLMAPAYLS